MSTSDPSRRESAYRLSYVAACTLLCALVLGVFLWKPGINGYGRAMFGDMVYGNAHRPFVYRTLLPTTVRVLASAVPSAARQRFGESLARDPAIANLLLILEWEKEYLVEYLLAVFLLYLCLWGFVWALRYLLTGVYAASSRVQDLTILLALVGLTQFFHYYSYLYDLPTLFLFTLGLGLLARAKWKLFLLVYFIGCLCKETTILLTLVFIIHFADRARLERRRFYELLLNQLVIFAVVKGALFVIFRQNLGSFVEFHVADHNLQFVQPYPLPTIFAWGGFVLLLFYRWSAKPVFLRHSLWIVVPLVVLTFLLGFLDELRDYYEAYPVVALLLLHSIGTVLGYPVRDAESGPTPA